MAEPPTAGGGVREGGGGATGRSLFSDSTPSLAPPSGGVGRPSGQHATARRRLEGQEGQEGLEDEWKAQWSRRLLRGPIHSEYQARFPWPPRSALKTTSAVYAPSTPAHHRGRSAALASTVAESRAESSAMMTSPVPQARSVSPLGRRGRGRGRADGGSKNGARKEEGDDTRGSRCTSEPPGGRRTAVDSLTGMPRNELRPSSSVDEAVQRADAKYVNGNKAAPAGASGVGEEKRVGKDEAPGMEDALVEPPPPSEEMRSGTRCSVSDGQEWDGGRDHVGGYTDLASKAVAADGSPVAEVNVVEQAWDAGGREAWREQPVGRGESTMTSGGKTLDYSHQVCSFCAVESVGSRAAQMV